MPRTDPPAVAGICEVDDSIDLTPFIAFANELTTDKPAAVLLADGITPYLSNTRLEMIERLLAAHFYSVCRDPQTVIEQVDTLRTTFETNKPGFNLKLTRFGQQAMVLDTTGSLAAFNNQLEKVRMKLPVGLKLQTVWLGDPNNPDQ